MNTDDLGPHKVDTGDGFAIRSRKPEPAINAPGVVLALCAVMIAIHVLLEFVGADLANRIILTLAFLPARYLSASELGGMLLPGGEVTRVTSFVSYALLHGSWAHMLINMVWMLAFGSVAARRLGTGRFLVLSMIAAAVAAAFSLGLSWGTDAVLVGASGAIAGQLAVAVRLIFAHGGTLMTSLRKDLSLVPPEPLLALFTNRSAIIFIAIWLSVDMISAGSGLMTDARIAWEAHLGGFLTGLLLFGFLDPKKI
jgi:membrane associated rhomboid family serine protease